jgi:hypothetical protein
MWNSPFAVRRRFGEVGDWSEPNAEKSYGNKRLFNTGAYKTSRILSEFPRETGYSGYPELRLLQ